MVHANPSATALLPIFSTALKTFTAFKSPFVVLRTLPSPSMTIPPQTIYVLDSSFNPPTVAHLRIASSAIEDHYKRNANPSSACRLILLLATQNADKPAQPASFEDRLVMMTLFAQDLLQYLAEAKSLPTMEPENEGPPSNLAIDIAITSYPRFIDKASAIASTAPFKRPATKTNLFPAPTEQYHLIGYDTLTRLLSPKYYPPNHDLSPLGDLFAHHRLRVTYRLSSDNKYGDREGQDRYLRDLRGGKREAEGGKREWAKRIEMEEGLGYGTSSTAVREAIFKGEDEGKEAVKEMCTRNVGEWIFGQGLYR